MNLPTGAEIPARMERLKMSDVSVIEWPPDPAQHSRKQTDIGCCPNTPRCEHPSFVHDVDTYEDPRPVCCVDGCWCGKTAGGVR